MIKFFKFLALLAYIVAATGCGLYVKDKIAIEKFSAATQEFASIAASELVQLRSDIIQMNKYRSMLGKKMKNFDGALTIERVNMRVKAVNALQDYGLLLQKLMVSQYDDDVRDSINSFILNLKKIEGLHIPKSNPKSMSYPMQLIDGFFIERYRKNAIKRVIERAHIPIIQITNLIERSFSPEDEYISLEYDKTVQLLKNSVVFTQQTADSKDIVAFAFLTSANNLADENSARFKIISESIINACRKLRQAEEELYKHIRTAKFDNMIFDSYTNTIKEFSQTYKLYLK